MFELNINGQIVHSETDKALLSFLRDDLKITSAKDGCSEGACGTCTVLVDGKAVKACVQKVSKFEGKRILTVEGLSGREREVYEYCFAEAGAVQCGFCIPGMVLCANVATQNFCQTFSLFLSKKSCSLLALWHQHLCIFILL